jgi:hypothetical protein
MELNNFCTLNEEELLSVDGGGFWSIVGGIGAIVGGACMIYSGVAAGAGAKMVYKGTLSTVVGVVAIVK